MSRNRYSNPLGILQVQGGQLMILRQKKLQGPRASPNPTRPGRHLRKHQHQVDLPHRPHRLQRRVNPSPSLHTKPCQQRQPPSQLDRHRVTSHSKHPSTRRKELIRWRYNRCWALCGDHRLQWRMTTRMTHERILSEACSVIRLVFSPSQFIFPNLIQFSFCTDCVADS